jgi:AraC family transcriptional activator of pobA
MIPVHNFKRDSKETTPFKFISLSQRSDYDTTKAHRHNYYEIFLFSKGGGYHEIDFNSHDITDFSIHFVAPGQVHKVRREPDSFGAILLFSSDFYHLGPRSNLPLHDYPFLNTHSQGSPIIQLKDSQFDELHNLSKMMGTEKSTNDFTGKEVIRTYLHVFLLKCLQYQSHQNPQQQSDGHVLFHNFKNLLETSYTSHHLSSYYANRLSVSTKKLNELCKTFAGATLNNLIKNRLILEAKRMLLHSNNSVKEISFQLGFEDPAYFNRFFRKHLEMSAVYFKKHFKQEDIEN